MLRDKEKNIAIKYNILDKVEKLQNDLLKINGIIDVEFDLSGFWDDFKQVIFLTKYEVKPYASKEYFTKRKEIIDNILKVIFDNGLKRTEDSIEDYGEWFYFVTKYSGNKWK
jgi:hypothetical protein